MRNLTRNPDGWIFRYENFNLDVKNRYFGDNNNNHFLMGGRIDY